MLVGYNKSSKYYTLTNLILPLKKGDIDMHTYVKAVPTQASLFKPINVSVQDARIEGETVLRVTKNQDIKEDDEATYARLIDANFQDGVIEVKVLSRLLADAPDHARGFIGLVFRVNDTDSAFESFYIRPTNGRSNQQLRRNRSTQYFSYPNFKYFHSRESNPGEYESYVDIGLDEWIDLKIVVQGNYGELYVNNANQPVLIVNDLKHGFSSGRIGLFVDIGTEGFFKDLKYTPAEV